MRQGGLVKMQDVQLTNLKVRLLEIMIEFDRICRHNNIDYSIAFGTLLGAVRHKGFIPWDDDVDVIMTRKDYMNLMEVFNKQADKRFEFVCVENNKGFSAPFGKIIDKSTILTQIGHHSDKIDLGVYIDVFPFDWVPADPVLQKKLFKKAEFRQRMWNFSANNFGKHSILIKMIRGFLNHTPLARNLAVKTNKWAASNRYEGKVLAAVTMGVNMHKETMDPVDMHDLVEYEFEGVKFLGLKKSDFYLTQWYGDYMQLPPVEKRVSNHNFTVIEKDVF